MHDMEDQPSVPFFRRLGMIGVALASVGTLLMIWMYREKQGLLRQKPPYPYEAQSPDIQTDFRGDLIGYAESSVALQSIRSENRMALLTLANAGAVLHRGSDLSGNTPEYVKAFDCIGEDPAALHAFRELVLNATPAGKIYGLCGLYLKRSTAFSLAREHLAQAARSPVWYKSSYDVFERLDVREVAERSEDICRELESSSSRAAAGQPRASSGRLTPDAELR